MGKRRSTGRGKETQDEESPKREQGVGKEFESLFDDCLDGVADLVDANGIPEGFAAEQAREDEEEGHGNDAKEDGPRIAKEEKSVLDRGAIAPRDGEASGRGDEGDGAPKTMADGIQPAVVFADEHAQEEAAGKYKASAKTGMADRRDEECKRNA